jgi:hypothetical protein
MGVLQNPAYRPIGFRLLLMTCRQRRRGVLPGLIFSRMCYFLLLKLPEISHFNLPASPVLRTGREYLN